MVPGSYRRSEAWPGVIVASSGIGLFLSLMPVWLSVGVATPHRFSGLDIPVIRWPVLAVGIVLIVSGLWEGVAQRNIRCWFGAAAASALLVILGLLTLSFEGLAALLPRWLLPRTVGRLTLSLGTGPGLWIALLLATIGVAAALAGHRIARAIPMSGRLRISDVNPRLAIAAVAVGAGGAGLALSRYQPWVSASANSHRFALAAWATPWAGPLTLLAVWGVLIGAAMVTLRRVVLGGLWLVVVGWFASFLSSLVIITSGTIERSGLALRLGHLGNFSLSTGKGAWSAFACSLLVIVGALLFLAGGIVNERGEVDTAPLIPD